MTHIRFGCDSKLSVTTVCYPVMDVSRRAGGSDLVRWVGRAAVDGGLGVSGKQSEPRHLVCYPAMDVSRPCGLTRFEGPHNLSARPQARPTQATCMGKVREFVDVCLAG